MEKILPTAMQNSTRTNFSHRPPKQSLRYTLLWPIIYSLSDRRMVSDNEYITRDR